MRNRRVGRGRPVAEAVVERLFVTAAHGRYVADGGAPAWLPTGQPHLKELGVPHTTCGVGTTGWHVFWLLDRTELADLCPDCLSRMQPRSAPARAMAGRPRR